MDITVLQMRGIYECLPYLQVVMRIAENSLKGEGVMPIAENSLYGEGVVNSLIKVP